MMKCFQVLLSQFGFNSNCAPTCWYYGSAYYNQKIEVDIKALKAGPCRLAR